MQKWITKIWVTLLRKNILKNYQLAENKYLKLNQVNFIKNKQHSKNTIFIKLQ